MSNLAFYATPIDFKKNDKLNNKINEIKKNKINSNMLKKLSNNSSSSSNSPSILEDNINNIHNNHNNLKEENENTLADFYSKELEEDIKKNQYNSDLYHNQNMNTDYLISNNLDLNKVKPINNNSSINKDTELLKKLDYIINMFDEQKEIKTNQKNEEIVMYCFLGIFVIYVLDSFVYIGKYSR